MLPLTEMPKGIALHAPALSAVLKKRVEFGG